MTVDLDVLDLIRAAGVDAFAHPTRPVWRTLAALLHAYRRLRIGNEAAFEVVEPEETQPFVRFLGDSIAAHGADVLVATLQRYRRFIWSIDPAPLLGPALVEHLRDWQPAFAQWLARNKSRIPIG